MDEDSPEDLVHDLLSKAMFGDQSLGMPILGTSELISVYSREDLFRYRGKHYRPQDTVVSLCGNYDPALVQALMEQFFGDWENPGAPAEIPCETLRQGQIQVKNKDTEQLHLCLGFPGIAYGSPDRYAQAVLSTVLGAACLPDCFRRFGRRWAWPTPFTPSPTAMWGAALSASTPGYPPEWGKGAGGDPPGAEEADGGGHDGEGIPRRQDPAAGAISWGWKAPAAECRPWGGAYCT